MGATFSVSRADDPSGPGAATRFLPNTGVSGDCDGVFPCAGIDTGNQQGDSEGLASYGGVSHPV